MLQFLVSRVQSFLLPESHFSLSLNPHPLCARVLRLLQDANIGAVKFNFRKFDVLEHAEPNSTVDVCGVVKRCGDVVELTSKKTGNTLYKRDLTLADDSVSKKAFFFPFFFFCFFFGFW